ncbi:MAG: hypothetical protein GJ676_19025 [Rhodobacteraceae bacterium]|nr:hypothetical protein [Paracoccaceae bacterium]
MTMQVTSKMARLGSRLVALGQRVRDLELRIARVENRPHPDTLALRRMNREKRRLADEIDCYEGLLRTLSRGLTP